MGSSPISSVLQFCRSLDNERELLVRIAAIMRIDQFPPLALAPDLENQLGASQLTALAVCGSGVLRASSD